MRELHPISSQPYPYSNFLDPYIEVFQKQKHHHPSVRNTSPAERVQKLKRLKNWITSHSKEIQSAIYSDLKKSPTEVDVTEVFPVIAEIDHAIRQVKNWMKPTQVRTPIYLLGTKSEIHYEPKGIVLIIGPWNYPFQLIVSPLISAICAGNCAIVKPSEVSENTSRVLREMISQVFNEDEIACFLGGAPVSQGLLKLPFDHIFFTGSSRLGKEVMRAASHHLASVTLELGGKSPAIVEESANLEQAARQIVWGKFLNAGQTCVAPDYVWIAEKNFNAFVDAAKKAIETAYGKTESDREKSRDFGRIISSAHFERIKGLLEGSVQQGAKIEIGGQFNDQDRYISPTLLSGVGLEHPIMAEEIFGPVLPVLTYRNLDEIYFMLRTQDKPLAVYIFSRNSDRVGKILKNTTAGGTAINTTLLHLLNPNLPFGGAGASGHGSYHGLFGFKTFSHERAVLFQSRFDMTKLLHPPYLPRVKKMIQVILRYFT